MKNVIHILNITLLFLLFSLSISSKNSQEIEKEGSTIFKGDFIQHNNMYTWMWGEHYRSLYYMPIKAKSISLNRYDGGLIFNREVKDLYGLLFFSPKENQYVLLKTLNAPTSFFQSSFFKKIYSKDLYHNTYLGNFIKESVTIENPFSFLIAADLADQIGLNENKVNLYEVKAENSDTIFNNIVVNNELVSLTKLPDLDSLNLITGVRPLLQMIHDNRASVDESMYIRGRVFDMLIGDWNKIDENWGWVAPTESDTINRLKYSPVVLDRSHAFSKVDGVFFKRMMNMLGLNFIVDYKPQLKNTRTFNRLGYPLDLALTANSTEDDWIEQTSYVQSLLTDAYIDSVFNSLPQELHIKTFDDLKLKLKARRDLLRSVVLDYYKELQKTPIITGSNEDESFFISSDSKNHLSIKILDNNNENKFEKKYSSRNTKEIWLYTLGGKNKLVIDKQIRGIPLTIVDGSVENNYDVKNAKGLEIYTSGKEKNNLDSLRNVKKIVVSDDSILKYDYTKYKYTKFSLTPIGLYDSDLGFNLGASASYTIYNFKRFPFTSKHQLSYNYSTGFTYQGIFPTYNPNKSFHLLAYMGGPSYFYNFFGFGNETDKFSGKNKKYNRVRIDKYLITPAYYYSLDKYQDIHIDGSFQSFKVKKPHGNNRYINTVFDPDEKIFKTQNYFDLSLSYSLNKDLSSVITDFSIDTKLGINVNLGDFAKNYSYLSLDVGGNINLTQRLVLATMLKGDLLFSNKYQFYQAVTTQLRGFRSNRFIGKQSLYQYTDLRLDMGRLNNPFTPLNYGLFVGIDHGRVWYPDEDSKKWHVSGGGGFWLTMFRNITGKFSYFVASDENRFMVELGLSF